MGHMYPVMQVITLSTKTFSNTHDMRNRLNKEVDFITFLRILLDKKGEGKPGIC